MLGGTFLGIIGVVLSFIYFIIKLTSTNSFGVPYLTPFSPTSLIGLKNSIIKFPVKYLNKREPIISNNTIKYRRKSQ